MDAEAYKRILYACKEDPEGEHACPDCGKMTPNLRAVVVNSILCITCTPQPKKIYGSVEYSHKTAGVLIMTEDKNVFDELKKPANERR